MKHRSQSPPFVQPTTFFTLPHVALCLCLSHRIVDALPSTAQQRHVKEDVPELSDDLLDRFIVVPEHHLLFCYMEKVACTNFNEVFRRLRIRYDPKQAEGGKWFRNSPEHHGLEKDDLARILVNTTWHKAVFYRDPVERFTSAYASKCGHVDPDGEEHCESQFGTSSLPFGDAVQWIADFDATGSGLFGCQDDSSFDPHFKRIVDFCGGLDQTLQYYDTVEALDMETAHLKVAHLLNHIGIDPSSVEGFDSLFPPASETAVLKSRPHVTDAESNMEEYFPLDEGGYRRSVLTEHFKPDYRLFGMDVPHKVSLAAKVSDEARWPLLDADR